jgi:hypothetical protein
MSRANKLLNKHPDRLGFHRSTGGLNKEALYLVHTKKRSRKGGRAYIVREK